MPQITAEMRRQWANATARLNAAGIPGTVGPGMLTIPQANAMIAKKAKDDLAANRAQNPPTNPSNRAAQIAAQNEKRLANANALAQKRADNLAEKEAQKQANLLLQQQRVASHAQLVAQKHANIVTDTITQFETTLLKQANNPLDYKGRNIFNPGRQAGLNAEQQNFANKIAKMGGYYQPVPLDSISNVLYQSEHPELFATTPNQITQTPVTTAGGTTIVTSPSGIIAASPSINTPVITGVNDTSTQSPLPYVGAGGVPVTTNGGSSGGAIYPGTIPTTDYGGGSLDSSGLTTNEKYGIAIVAAIGLVWYLKKHKKM